MAQPLLHTPGPVTHFASLPGYVRLPCNRCLFFDSSLGCKRGDRCLFCHHTEKSNSSTASTHTRPLKDQRDKLKAIISQQVREINLQTQEPQEEVVLLQLMAQQTNFARNLCLQELNRLGGQGSEQRDEGMNAVAAVPAGGTGRRTGTCEGIKCFSL
eukprot:s216_g10.t1